MSHYWKAEVTVTGVPLVTEDESEAVVKSFPGWGGLRKDADKDEVSLFWRFANGSPDIWDAIERASATWRGAVGHIESAIDPVCTDFRVQKVDEL